MIQSICYSCKSPILRGDKIGRQETCSGCGVDLHVCYQCQHYDPRAYNECREAQADRVLEKNRANFCDFFTVASQKEMEQRASGGSRRDELWAKAEALFKKNS